MSTVFVVSGAKLELNLIRFVLPEIMLAVVVLFMVTNLAVISAVPQ